MIIKLLRGLSRKKKVFRVLFLLMRLLFFYILLFIIMII